MIFMKWPINSLRKWYPFSLFCKTYSPMSIQLYKVHFKKYLYFFPPKPTQCEQDPPAGDEGLTLAFLRMHENFETVSYISSQLLCPEYRHVVCLSDLWFNTRWMNTLSRDNASSFANSLPKLKLYRRFSRPLVMMLWTKLRSRSSTTTSNMATPQWKTIV